MDLSSSLLEFLPVALNEGKFQWYLYTTKSDFSYGREITSKETGHLVWSYLYPCDVCTKRTLDMLMFPLKFSCHFSPVLSFNENCGWEKVPGSQALERKERRQDWFIPCRFS